GLARATAGSAALTGSHQGGVGGLVRRGPGAAPDCGQVYVGGVGEVLQRALTSSNGRSAGWSSAASN
ncbi:hypothetical protein, partial [Streptomyces clavuligerus]|uniref:hypothetical protein n=1 Tax=Streptomyces clavuligerus TaxID=1901 RepID=UPI001E3C3044